jgi:hypothetical protein
VTRKEAEHLLAEWATVSRDRDNRVRAAVAAGLSKYRVHQLTGLGRSTIDRIMAAAAPAGAADVQPGGGDEG